MTVPSISDGLRAGRRGRELSEGWDDAYRLAVQTSFSVRFSRNCSQWACFAFLTCLEKSFLCFRNSSWIGWSWSARFLAARLADLLILRYPSVSSSFHHLFTKLQDSFAGASSSR